MKDRQEIINNNKRNLLETMQKLNFNNPNINSGSTLEHELLKCEICYKLKQQGREFVCEAKLKDARGRPDILVLDLVNPIAYEIVCSEKEESLIKKKEKYQGIRIVIVRELK